MYTGHENNCIICGKPLVYSTETVMRECCVCHKVFPSRRRAVRTGTSCATAATPVAGRRSSHTFSRAHSATP